MLTLDDTVYVGCRGFGNWIKQINSEDGARFYTTSQLADVRHDGQEGKAGDVDHLRVGD